MDKQLRVALAALALSFFVIMGSVGSAWASTSSRLAILETTDSSHTEQIKQLLVSDNILRINIEKSLLLSAQANTRSETEIKALKSLARSLSITSTKLVTGLAVLDERTLPLLRSRSIPGEG